MSENQGLQVHGYQPQSDSNVQLVNTNKLLEEGVLRKIDELQIADGVDLRWLSIARTHIEQGFMAMNRAIFRPQRIPLGENE